MNPKDIVTWIAIVSAIATGTARVISLEERQANQLTEINRLGHELADVRGYLTAAENRISALERDREMLEKVHQLELRIASIEVRTRRR